MKLKHWLVILLLLNAAVLAWQWDMLARWGWGPNLQREPERLKQQIKPEALKITRPGQDASAPAAASSETPAKLAAAAKAVGVDVHKHRPTILALMGSGDHESWARYVADRG